MQKSVAKCLEPSEGDTDCESRLESRHHQKDLPGLYEPC